MHARTRRRARRASARTFVTASTATGRTVVEQRLGGEVTVDGRRRLVAAALDGADAVLLELVVERAGLDAQQARGLGLHAPALFISPLDELPLEVLQKGGERHL